jgi:hypothetical protein
MMEVFPTRGSPTTSTWIRDIELSAASRGRASCTLRATGRDAKRKGLALEKASSITNTWKGTGTM